MLIAIILLVISWVALVLCITTPDYAAFRLWNNKVLLIGNGKAFIFLSDELHEDMKLHHKLSGLLPKDKYDELRRRSKKKGRAKRTVARKRTK